MIAKTHLQDYFEYYLTLTNPGYAVLVTGMWGVGKTFQVKSIIPESERYYVSLFGVQTIDQIHSEVLASAFPEITKANELLNQVSERVSDMGGLFALAGTAPNFFNAVFRRELSPKCTLIIDDLERSQINLKEILGAINFYVEQKKFRVVVIAHDKRIEEEFLELKEKIFGQVIRVDPQFADAFETFTLHICGKEEQGFIRSYSDAIIETFRQSQEKSLRILRHVIEDLGRLYKALSGRHLENKEAMYHLVELFTAFDIETRSGRLGEADLKNRRGVKYASAIRDYANNKENKKPLPLALADERFPAIDLEDGLLSDDLLISIFIYGRYSSFEISESLDNSAYFIEPSDVPPWKVVINFDELEDDVVNNAQRRMDEQFSEREVINSGEMLHIFALRLMMVENGIKQSTLEDETDSCKSYIDDLLEEKCLPPRETDREWYNAFSNSYGGYRYWLSETTLPYFEIIYEYLIKAREKALTDTFPEVTKYLLELIAADSKLFFEKISITNNGENPYALIPILHEIPPGDFAEAWLNAPRDKWRMIQYALQNRYEHGHLEKELSIERDWILRLHSILLERSSAAEGFSALRIRRIIPKVFDELAVDEDS